MKKIYVLDTNVLIQAPHALKCFDDNEVVLPLVVLEELDGHKRDEGERGANVREAIRILEQLRGAGDLVKGVKLDNGGFLRVEKNFKDVELPKDMAEYKSDNRILKVCKGLSDSSKEQVILVTKDILMRIKAQILGVRSEDFTTEQVAGEGEQYSGRISVYAPEEAFKDFKKKGIPVSKVYCCDEEGNQYTPELYENEFVVRVEFYSKFNYEDGVKKAEEVLAIFGKEYKGKVKAAFEQRWIDVEENIGKRSGAYSGGSYDTNAFMLLNWQETLDDLFTLVHEMGHSMHSAFTRENQPYVYGDYPIFLAEIASTTNENILTETLLKESKDDKERFALLNHWLDSFRGTVFRQSQFAEFEQKIHEADAAGEVLTSEYLNSLYGEINEKYYNLAAKENPEIQYEWARIPHFY